METFKIAQNCIDGKLSYGIYVSVEGTRNKIPTFITSEKKLIPLINSEVEKEFGFSVDSRHTRKDGKIIPPEDYALWSLNGGKHSIEEYLSDKYTPVSAFDVFNKVESIFKDYLWLPEDSKSYSAVYAIYTMLSYVHQLFHTVPYLNIWGTKATGKTLTLEIFEKLAFNPILVSSITTAATFRVIERDNPTLLFDEHKLGNKSNQVMQEMVPIINSGYKKSGRVIRCDGDLNNPESFMTYGPKIIAGTNELLSQIQDRSIVLVSQRAPDKSSKELGIKEFYVNSNDSELAEVRNELYCWALSWSSELFEIYNTFASVDIPGIRGRAREIWLSLLVLALQIEDHQERYSKTEETHINLFDNLHKFALLNKERKGQLDSEEIRDRSFLECVIEFVVDSSHNIEGKPYCIIGGILAEHIRENMGWEHFSTRGLGSRLYKLQVTDGTDHYRPVINIGNNITKTCYLIMPERLERAARNYGVPDNIIEKLKDIM